MEIFTLFKTPIEKSSFEAWGKMSDDIAKVAIMTVPVVLYGDQTISMKLINCVLLACLLYLFLAGGRLFRQKAERKK